MMRIVAIFLIATGLVQINEAPKLSPTGRLKAYYTLCSVQSGGCPPSVVVQDANGQVIREFHVIPRGANGQPCMSILNIIWVSDNSLGAECHSTPSSSEYIETDITTGKVVRELSGLFFTPSRWQAHRQHWADPTLRSSEREELLPPSRRSHDLSASERIKSESNEESITAERCGVQRRNLGWDPLY